MPKVSVTVITRNEASNIARALESAVWADEVVVVDCGSTDDTVTIARRYTERVFVRGWPGYGAQKHHAAALAAHDWILSIDADERITPGLAGEIRALLETEPPARGYRVPRVTWHLGRWIRSTDWSPDYQLRLYDRRAGSWIERRVHESVRLDGRPGVLEHELEHYAYRDLKDHLETMGRYADLAARQMREEGKRATFWGLACHPPLAWLRNYVLRLGFRDGVPGLIVSGLNACYVFLKLAKLWELQRSAFAPPALRRDEAASGPNPGPRPPASGP